MKKIGLTPAMKQFIEIKNQYQDAIVLFRMGDFYETFYEDAKKSSEILGITLTSRGKGENKAPLAGIPYHALETYLGKLIKAGQKVVIVEQLEDPKKSKGIVKRGVVRVVTPGTIIEQNILEEKSNNYIMSLYFNKNFFISLIDLSTGEFICCELNKWDEVLNLIAKYNPSECIISENNENNIYIKELRKKIYVTTYGSFYFLKDHAYNTLLNHFKVKNFKVFGIDEKNNIINSAGALISYLKETQKKSLIFINKIRLLNHSDYMILDKYTIKNLELIKNNYDNTYKNTLLSILDKTKTPMGGRLLKKFILNPLTKINKIEERLNAVQYLIENNLVREELNNLLSNIKDLERLISRINLGNALPRDLLSIGYSLNESNKLKTLLKNSNNLLINKLINFTDLKELENKILTTIKQDPSNNIKEGNIIKKNISKELDELRNISENCKNIILKMEEDERQKTGIKSLKIKYNRVFGYFIEVTKTNLHLVPNHYIRKQTQANSERYITEELKQFEEKILNAEEKIKELEYNIYLDLISFISSFTFEIQKLAQNIAYLDVLNSFANVSIENKYTKPKLNNGYNLIIKDGRHPVLEKLEELYVSNNLRMDENSFLHIITGPNMAGKSSFMRQIALIVLMSQIGCFIPASYGEISIVDRIFTRVGAHDDLSKGESTFMIEMLETANILNNATNKSLIILDEIGRGTSTYDGMAIAFSVAEYIHNNIGAKTLFATHYHQLNLLEEYLSGVKNFNVAVKEEDNNIIFLHKIVEGGTDKSYGVHVAKLAGLPNEVLTRSYELINKFEKKSDFNFRKNIIFDNNNQTSQKDISFEEELEKKDKSLFDYF